MLLPLPGKCPMCDSTSGWGEPRYDYKYTYRIGGLEKLLYKCNSCGFDLATPTALDLAIAKARAEVEAATPPVTKRWKFWKKS